MSKIIILGDLFPKSITNFPTIPNNDFCVANLECAITSHNKAIKKDGPSLKISPQEAESIKSLGVCLVGMANNHVMDFGFEGINDTISCLDSMGIKHAGSSLDGNYYLATVDNKKICFYFVSEHQYNYFNDKHFGVNVLDQSVTFEELLELKTKCDFLIVLYHGGKEYYEYPTPFQQSICHKFVDSGADLVVCQHSHCVGCIEVYKESDIVYGQGNFAFPYSDKEHFKTGIIIEVELNDLKKPSLQFIPIVHKEINTIRYANDEEKKYILKKIESCSSKLKEKSAEVLYNDMVSECGLDFLYKLLNKGRLFIRLDTSRFFKNRMLKKYIRKNQKYFLYLYNYFNCETHIEYIKAILSNQIKDEAE